MTVWEQALAAWRRPGVEALCLELQNAHGQHPALLLWRHWALTEQRRIGPGTLARAVDLTRRWDGQVIRPLRALRTRLKTSPPHIDEAGRLALRAQIQQDEVAAERLLLDALAALAEAPVAQNPPADGGLGALVEVADAWRPPAPLTLLARLAEAL